MNTWKQYLGVAGGAALLAAVVAMATTGPVRAAGALKPVEALIVNRDAMAVPVRVARETERFQIHLGGAVNNPSNASFTVPDGSRLVLEHVSMGAIPVAELQYCRLDIEFEGGTVFEWLPMHFSARDGSANYYAASVQTLVLAEPGNIVRPFCFSAASDVNFNNMTTLITGHFEPLP